MSTQLMLPEQTTFLETAEILRLQVNGQSRRAYQTDALIFQRWLQDQGIFDLRTITYDTIVQYHAYLFESYASSTAGRRFVVMRRLLEVAVDRGLLEKSPVGRFKSKRQPDDSSPHTALSKREARKLLAAVDQSTAKGQRDYALLMLLIYGGLRRAECASVKIGDITSKEEHKVLVVQHGKGSKRRDIPLRPDVFRAIKAYLEAVDRLNDSPDALLFAGFRKGNRSQPKGITDRQISNIVEFYAQQVGITCSPHDLRATFITLAIDTGSPIIQVQRLAGHSSPVTTEKYYSRHQDLDKSPVYRITLDD